MGGYGAGLAPRPVERVCAWTTYNSPLVRSEGKCLRSPGSFAKPRTVKIAAKEIEMAVTTMHQFTCDGCGKTVDHSADRLRREIPPKPWEIIQSTMGMLAPRHACSAECGQTVEDAMKAEMAELVHLSFQGPAARLVMQAKMDA